MLCKLAEHVACKRLTAHQVAHNQYVSGSVGYSAYYCENHSTETAILKVVFSLILAVDKGNSVVLVLSIKVLHSIHSIQINCISSLFCLSDTVLSWFNSYLPGNWRSLCIDGSSSVEIRLQFGDPQRFVIGLFKIKMYNSPFTQS